MAVLSDADFREIKKQCLRGPLRLVFRALSLTRPEWKATFQAVEDYVQGSVTSRPGESLKSALSAAAGTSLTNAQTRAFLRVWKRGT